MPGIHGHTVTAYVGNGGFSLRRIAACRQLLAEFAEEAAWFGKRIEDMFFALFGQFSQQFTLLSLRGRRVCLGGDCRACTLSVRGSCRWRSTPTTSTTLNSSSAPSITRHRCAADTLQARAWLRLVNGRVFVLHMPMNPNCVRKATARQRPCRANARPGRPQDAPAPAMAPGMFSRQPHTNRRKRNEHCADRRLVARAATENRGDRGLPPRAHLQPRARTLRRHHGEASGSGKLRGKLSIHPGRDGGRESVVSAGAKVEMELVTAPCTWGATDHRGALHGEHDGTDIPSLRRDGWAVRRALLRRPPSAISPSILGGVSWSSPCHCHPLCDFRPGR